MANFPLIDETLHEQYGLPERPSGKIIAEDVDYSIYETYRGERAEWVRGFLVGMSPVTVMHDEISGYLYLLLKAYVALNPVGIVRQAPFTMKLDAVKAGREPDLMVVLDGNPAKQTDTALIGPADLVIEIVSRESEQRDYVEKRREYEIAGVREYWIFDPLRDTSLIYRRVGDESYFKQVQLDPDGSLTTPLMPGLKLHVPTLWRMPLPDFVQVYDAVKAMLGK